MNLTILFISGRVEISNSKGSFHKGGYGVTSLCFEPIDESMRFSVMHVNRTVQIKDNAV